MGQEKHFHASKWARANITQQPYENGKFHLLHVDMSWRRLPLSHQGHGLVLDRLSHLLVYLTRFPKAVAWSMTFRRTLCLKNLRNLGGPLWLLCLCYPLEEVHLPGSNPKDRLWRLDFNNLAWEHQANPLIGRGSQKQLVDLLGWWSAIFPPIYRAHLLSMTFMCIGGFTFIVTYEFH